MEELLEYKCPCCGGAIEFNSSLQKMKCPFCDTEFDMKTLAEFDDILKKERPDNMNWDVNAGESWQDGETDGINVYVCKSCGGEIAGDENTAATACPFCGNPVVMTGNLSGTLKPDLVIPFKLDKQAAKNAFMLHLSKKRLLPKAFKKETHIDEIKGLYVPFWLFDADADANMRYTATRTRFWSDSKYEYTETSFYSVFRAGSMSFENIPADGSSKMPDDLMESIEPYDMSQAVDFQTAYLAGYLADKYDVTAEECTVRANSRAKTSTELSFDETVRGYDSVTPQNCSIQISNGKTKYALLPVWILNTTWHGYKYTFAMNGQTGKFVGNLPVDKSALHRWFALLTAVGAVASYGIIQLIHHLF